MLHLEPDEWPRLLAARPVGAFWPFPAADGAPNTVDAGGRPGSDFADLRAQPGVNLYDGVRKHIGGELNAGRQVVVAAWSAGSRDRLGGVLKEHGLAGDLLPVETWREARALGKGQTALAILALEHGFVTSDLAVICEQDILGDRLVRPTRRRRRAEQFLAEASALAEGDLVVHVDHGIGRYDGLVTLDVLGRPPRLPAGPV